MRHLSDGNYWHRIEDGSRFDKSGKNMGNANPQVRDNSPGVVKASKLST